MLDPESTQGTDLNQKAEENFPHRLAGSLLPEGATRPPGDLKALRQIAGHLGQLWAEMERFVLALFDGWSVILHRLALRSELSQTTDALGERISAELRQFDGRLKELTATLAALEGHMRKSTVADAGSHFARWSGEAVDELPPLVVPIRPELGEARERRPGTASPEHRCKLPPESKPQATSDPQIEDILRLWTELSQKLEELFPESSSR